MVASAARLQDRRPYHRKDSPMSQPTRADFIAFLQGTPAGRLSEVDLNAIADAAESAGIVLNAHLEGDEEIVEPEPAPPPPPTPEPEEENGEDDDEEEEEEEEAIHAKPKRKAATTSRKHPRKR